MMTGQVLGVVVVLGIGVALVSAGATAEMLTGQTSFIAGLLDGLGRWWNSLSPVQQILIVGAVAALLTLSGVGFIAAIGIASTASTVAAWGQGEADFIRNPREATTRFFRELTPGQAATYGAELLLSRLIPARLGADVGWGLRREIDEVMRRYPNRADLHDYFRSTYLGPRDERGMATVEQLLGLGRRRDPDFQLPTKPRNVPASRVALDLEHTTVHDVLHADPANLNPTQRLLQDDYRRHLTNPDGSPLPTDELNRKLAELRQEGASWVKSGRTPPNAKYAGQTVFLKDPTLDQLYSDGIYVNLHGYPDFVHMRSDRRSSCRQVGLVGLTFVLLTSCSRTTRYGAARQLRPRDTFGTMSKAELRWF